eukprot:scaffold10339_cov94-Skeletonema_dohrnii-CCMP3373.AAC.1
MAPLQSNTSSLQYPTTHRCNGALISSSKIFGRFYVWSSDVGKLSPSLAPISIIVCNHDALDPIAMSRSSWNLANNNKMSSSQSSCSCTCHSSTAVDTTKMAASNNNHNDNESTAEPHNRPTMEALHQLLQNRQWDQVQHSIQLDASVAMRIDDSAEEDCWIDEVRRRWIASSAADDDETEQITTNKLRHFYKQMKMKNQCKTSRREEDDGDPPMQL